MEFRNLIAGLSFLIIGMGNANAQDIKGKDVPIMIKKSFKSKYVNATDIDWELKGENYEVSFDIGDVDHKALFSKTGKLVSHQKEISKRQLPAIIAKNIKIKYPGSRVDDVDWISTNGKISYKIDIEGKYDLDVWYTADGKFIKEEKD